jgi:YgiT-type zinc finger domain-containing protein
VNCLICRRADLVDSLTSIPFERDEFHLLIQDVPAWVCPNCGEAIVEEGVAIQLVRKAESLLDEGMWEGVCEY